MPGRRVLVRNEAGQNCFRPTKLSGVGQLSKAAVQVCSSFELKEKSGQAAVVVRLLVLRMAATDPPSYSDGFCLVRCFFVTA